MKTKELKIKEGAVYITKSNNIALIVSVKDNRAEGEYKSDNIWIPAYWEIKDGRVVCSNGESFDIISMYIGAPLYDSWSNLPEWANKYIAMNKSGVWYSFKTKPSKEKAFWSCTGVVEPLLHFKPLFNDSWEDSLLENPNIK